MSPDGKSVYATVDGFPVSIFQFTTDPATGALSSKAPPTVATPSPLGVVVSPDGKSVYVANQDANTVSEYSTDPLTGTLSPKTPPTITTGSISVFVAVTPDGKSAYVTNYGDNTVSEYNIDSTTGALSPKTTATIATGPAPYGMAVGSLPISHPTASTVSCSPGTLAVGQSTTCTVTITDNVGSGQTTPTGMVSFASSGAGSFSGAGSCTLSGNGASASCQVAYTPSATGTPRRSDTITASYGGDPTHTTSSGSATVTVQPTSKQDCMNGRYHNYDFPNQGQCIKYVNHGG